MLDKTKQLLVSANDEKAAVESTLRETEAAADDAAEAHASAPAVVDLSSFKEQQVRTIPSSLSLFALN